MRKGQALLLVAGVLGAVIWYFTSSKPAQIAVPPPTAQVGSAPSEAPSQSTAAHLAASVSPPPANSPGEIQESAVTPPPPTAALNAPAVQALTAPDPSEPRPVTLLEHMRTAFRNYSSMFGSNPVGTNPEITKALSGDNPKQVNFIKPEGGMRINGNGELIDSWGTPFFFHQLSGTQMEIRSAGPDKKMWTSDDLVIK
jgi:hypothetical protein